MRPPLSDTEERARSISPHTPDPLPANAHLPRRKEIIFLLLLQCALLAVFPFVDFTYTLVKKVRTQPGVRHPVFHHTFRPNFAGPRAHGPIQYRFATNSLGFADQAPRFIPLSSPKYRILFLGDSFTEGVGLPYDQTFVGLFGAMLDDNHFQVLNAAVSSYSPRLYYLKLKYFLDRGLKIDELFVFVDISDIQNEAVYARLGAGWADTEAEVLDPYTLRLTTDLNIRYWLASHFGLTSSLYRYLSAPADKGRPRETGLQRTYVEILRIRPPEAEGIWALGAWTMDATLLRNWGVEGLALCRQYMGEVADLCHQRHIKLRVAVYPWPHQIVARDLKSIQVTYWKDFAASRNVPFLDYFPSFIDDRSADNIIEKYFIRGDYHWNREGHKLVAEGLGRFWKEGR
jgi:hypothetical protein